jgi:hypothetical protein
LADKAVRQAMKLLQLYAKFLPRHKVRFRPYY